MLKNRIIITNNNYYSLRLLIYDSMTLYFITLGRIVERFIEGTIIICIIYEYIIVTEYINKK